jgi:hypothetical protein
LAVDPSSLGGFHPFSSASSEAFSHQSRLTGRLPSHLFCFTRGLWPSIPAHQASYISCLALRQGFANASMASTLLRYVPENLRQ